jgi:trk system potassium uptake protein
MNILIAGDSEITFHLARLLYDENHDITLFCPEDQVELVNQNFDVLTFTGDPTSIDDLKNAGINKMDLMISVYMNGRTNLLSTILAKNLGAKSVLPR